MLQYSSRPRAQSYRSTPSFFAFTSLDPARYLTRKVPTGAAVAGQAADSRTRRRASRMEGDGCAGRQARFHKIRAWPSLALLVQQAALGAKPAETLAR